MEYCVDASLSEYLTDQFFGGSREGREEFKEGTAEAEEKPRLVERRHEAPRTKYGSVPDRKAAATPSSGGGTPRSAVSGDDDKDKGQPSPSPSSGSQARTITRNTSKSVGGGLGPRKKGLWVEKLGDIEGDGKTDKSPTSPNGSTPSGGGGQPAGAPKQVRKASSFGTRRVEASGPGFSGAGTVRVSASTFFNQHSSELAALSAGGGGGGEVEFVTEDVSTEDAAALEAARLQMRRSRRLAREAKEELQSDQKLYSKFDFGYTQQFSAKKAELAAEAFSAANFQYRSQEQAFRASHDDPEAEKPVSKVLQHGLEGGAVSSSSAVLPSRKRAKSRAGSEDSQQQLQQQEESAGRQRPMGTPTALRRKSSRQALSSPSPSFKVQTLSRKNSRGGAAMLSKTPTAFMATRSRETKR